jgi:pyrimidine-nucleoside phosphorylase
VLLGAGRTKVDEAIDPKAGILLKKKIGDAVDVGEVLAVLYTDRPGIIDEAHHRIERSFTIATEPSTQPPLIAGLIDETGLHPWHSQ